MKALWMTPDQSRFFLVPEEIPLPPGELAVRAGKPDLFHADAAFLASYEVTKLAAQQFIDDHLGVALGAVQRTLTGLFAGFTGRKQPTQDERAPFQLFGVTLGQMYTEPASIGTAVARFFSKEKLAASEKGDSGEEPVQQNVPEQDVGRSRESE